MSNGAAAFYGGKKSRVRKGDFSGAIGADDFKRLGKEVVEAGLFDLKCYYKGSTKDAAAVKITVVYSGVQTTVRNFRRSD